MLIVLTSLLVIFILCSALLSASETALFSLSSMKIRAFKHSSDPKKALIGNLLSRPRDLLVTILMLNVLMNILVQNVVSSIFGTFSGWLLTVGLPLGLTLIFGEVIPKTVAISLNEKLSYLFSPVIYRIMRFMGPVRIALNSIAGVLSRFSFFFLRKEKEISLDELRHTLQTSRDFGVLSREEAKLVKGYLDLEEHTTKEIMRPRGDIIYYNTADPLSSLVHFFLEEECTRVPVCRGDLENLEGIISSGAFFINQHNIKTQEDIKPYLEKPIFVPESQSAKMLLSQMLSKGIPLAIVLDEYRSIIGLITIEDLVEVVVGQIADRRDEKTLFTRASNDVIIASGKLELSEFEEIFDHRLLSKSNMVTIGGWLIEKFGDIPQPGDKISDQGFLFHVLAADPHRVRRIYIRKLQLKKPGKKTRDID